jgi:hypothetical protein
MELATGDGGESGEFGDLVGGGRVHMSLAILLLMNGADFQWNALATDRLGGVDT